MSTFVDPPYAHAVVLHLISRLVSFLQKTQDEGRWDVAGPALSRASSVTSRLRTWEESAENANMILALEGKVVPSPAQPMQWEPSVTAHGHRPHHQQQNIHPPMHPPPSASTSSASEPPMSAAASYTYSPSAQVMQHPSPSASTSSHHSQPVYNPSSVNVQPAANVPRSPTPSHVPVLYPGQYVDGLPAGATGAASVSATGQHLNAQGQAPTFIDSQGTQSLGSELDMLGMDGVTFWTPWMSNVGIDGNGNMDEALSTYSNFARPAGW